MQRSRAAILVVIAAVLTGCAPDAVLGPGDAQPATVVLSANGSEPLASFGDTVVLTPQVLDQAGNRLNGIQLRWRLSSTDVVHQDAEGVFRAVGDGRVTIVAEIDHQQNGARPAGYWVSRLADSVTVTVAQRPAQLIVAPVDTMFRTVGGRRQVTVQVADARGNPMQVGTPPLTWLSSDGSVVSVDSIGGVLALREGSAQITVQADALSGIMTFHVRPRLPHTSCMVFSVRRQAQESCATIDFTMHEPEAGR